MKKIAIITAAVMLGACASHPNKIDAAHVSSQKYKDYDCEQIGEEQQAVSERATDLYFSLKKERANDNAQMGVGLVLFWPALFFLEGGDGPEAAEYAQLKGEYKALDDMDKEKNCGIYAEPLDDIIKQAVKDKKEEKKQKT